MFTIDKIVATVQCDGCGNHVPVTLDTAAELSSYRDFHSLIKAEIMFDPLGMVSVQKDLFLCKSCTEKADNIGDDYYRPSREEILKACGK